MCFFGESEKNIFLNILYILIPYKNVIWKIFQRKTSHSNILYSDSTATLSEKRTISEMRVYFTREKIKSFWILERHLANMIILPHAALGGH